MRRPMHAASWRARAPRMGVAGFRQDAPPPHTHHRTPPPPHTSWARQHDRHHHVLLLLLRVLLLVLLLLLCGSIGPRVPGIRRVAPNGVHLQHLCPAALCRQRRQAVPVGLADRWVNGRARPISLLLLLLQERPGRAARLHLLRHHGIHAGHEAKRGPGATTRQRPLHRGLLPLRREDAAVRRRRGWRPLGGGRQRSGGLLRTSRVQRVGRGVPRRPEAAGGCNLRLLLLLLQ